MVELTQFEILQYSMLIVYVSFLIIISLMFFKKYSEFKRREYLFVGLAFLLSAVFVYIPYIISFVMILLSGRGFDDIVFIVAMSFLPTYLIAWMITFSNLTYESKKKLILLSTIIVISILEIFYYTIFFLKGSSAIGCGKRGIYMYWTPFSSLFIIIINLIFLLTALLFAFKAFKSNIKENRLKGKFLVIATILIILGSIFDGVLTLPGDLFIITRIIQIIAVILYYIGFILPYSIKNLFLKEN